MVAAIQRLLAAAARRRQSAAAGLGVSDGDARAAIRTGAAALGAIAIEAAEHHDDAVAGVDAGDGATAAGGAEEHDAGAERLWGSREFAAAIRAGLVGLQFSSRRDGRDRADRAACAAG